VNVSVPAAAPGCVGANLISTWQLEFAASVVVPHVLLEILNGEVMAIALIGIATTLLLPA
jgi:hypothetical protein